MYNVNNHNSAVLGVAGVANRLGRAIVRENKSQSQLQISRDPVRMQAEGVSDRMKESVRSHRPRLFNRRRKSSLWNAHRRLGRSSCDGRHPSAYWLEWLPQIRRQRLRSRVRCILCSPWHQYRRRHVRPALASRNSSNPGDHVQAGGLICTRRG